ncbi:MAG: HAD-IA family hydrolase [Sedimentibacter sp.]|uniref:HAD-IA family hydrolase n=1 Tax=Sedimentibacter sp. TaxID=1960295 RepID=UPI0029811724|nr:HAD-IA family hydrolase [Sedimentibacter sp.]MDW5298551.1 HAD-IA family hydrolase [Sedimentibacter sp.]
MIDTVIFDFDGTLANTNKMIINSFKHIYTEFLQKNCSEEYIMSTFGEPLELTLTRDFEAFSFEDVIACYRDYQKDRFNEEVTLYETVEDTLNYLKGKSIKLGIATSRLRSSTVSALETFNIAKYFDVVVSADDVTKHKPDKEPLVKAINELGSTTESTLYVGDSRFDMECALNALVTPILVGWQLNSNDLAQKYKIKHVLEKMWDLTNLIQ